MSRRKLRPPPRSRPPRPAADRVEAAAEPTPDPEAVAETLAARQHGLVTRRQLLEAGVPAAMVERRVRARRFVPVHRGVYRIGPLEAPRSREMAALLACGPTAAISHESAAGLRGIAGARPSRRVVDVALRAGHRRPRRGIRLHMLPTLVDRDISTVDGLAVTTAARTLLDVASAWPPASLERALADAFDRRIATAAAVRAQLDRHPGYPGTRRLRLLLEGDGPQLTRSELEATFLALVRKAGTDRPETNVRIAGWELDFFWPKERLAVELDGVSYHSGPDAFERDRARDFDLAARGIDVIRVTWKELTRRPEAVLVRLGGALFSRR